MAEKIAKLALQDSFLALLRHLRGQNCIIQCLARVPVIRLIEGHCRNGSLRNHHCCARLNFERSRGYYRYLLVVIIVRLHNRRLPIVLHASIGKGGRLASGSARRQAVPAARRQKLRVVPPNRPPFERYAPLLGDINSSYCLI